MKRKIVLIAIFFCNCCAFGVVTDSIKMTSAHFYFGLGGGGYSSLKINDVFSGGKLSTAKQTDLAGFFGFDFNKKAFGLNYETSIYPSFFNDPDKIRLVVFPVRIGLNYNFYRSRKTVLAVNVNYNYTGYFCSVYYGNYMVNASNIQASSGGVLQLYSNTQNAGLQIVARMLLGKQETLVRIGYDIPFRESAWHSRNNLLEGFPKEKISKFYLSVGIPLCRR